MWTNGLLGSSFKCYLWQSGKLESAGYVPAWVGYSGVCHFKLPTRRNLSISFQTWQRSELLPLQDLPRLSHLLSGSCRQELSKILGLVTACCGFSLAGKFCSRILFWVAWNSVRFTLRTEIFPDQSFSLHVWLSQLLFSINIYSPKCLIYYSVYYFIIHLHIRPREKCAWILMQSWSEIFPIEPN